MEKKITFNELRKIKDSLPDGSIRKMAQEFEVTEAKILDRAKEILEAV